MITLNVVLTDPNTSTVIGYVKPTSQVTVDLLNLLSDE